MKSDKDDGFYIESTTDGKPFYWSTLVFDEEKEIPKKYSRFNRTKWYSIY